MGATQQVTWATSHWRAFSGIYKQELERAVREHPEEYSWPIEDVPRVVDLMMAAIKQRAYNKDGRAVKATCKVIGIKHTYKAIAEYLGL